MKDKKNKTKKKSKEYISETKEFKKLDLEEKDNIETIDEIVTKEKKKRLKKKFRILKYIFILALIGTLCLLYARYISTSGLIIKEYAIKSTELNKDYDGLKIVHVTDLHYGSTVFKKELNNVVKETNEQKPDLVVFTGDLVEQGVKLKNQDIEDIIECFNNFDANIGYYAVKGNHDYENNYFDTIMAKTKFKVLYNESELLYVNSATPIRIIGYDDLLKGKPVYDEAFNLPEGMEKAPYTIVLIHEPDQIDEFKDKHKDFNVVFAGHSHLGQVRFPLVGALWTPIGSKKYYDEHYIVDGKDLYISGGVGTTLLRLRFLNKPSITLYRFYAQ